MNLSKSLLSAVVLAALAYCVTPASKARVMSILTYDELLNKSDLVVIATPTHKTTDTAEESFLPNIYLTAQDGRQSRVGAIGVETTFKVCAVLKGDKGMQQVVLHHYRQASSDVVMLNGPLLVSFVPFDGSYLLFLVREADGRYAPTGSQTDPGLKAVSKVRLELN